MPSKTVVLNNECCVTKNELSDDTNVTSGAVCKASGPLFTTRFVYNSNANPALVVAALARTKQSSQKFFCQVRSRNFWASNSKGGKKVGNSESCVLQDTYSQENVKSSVTVDAGENDLEGIKGQAGTSQGVVSHLGFQMDENGSGHSQVVPGVTNDRLHRHICAFCLFQGKQLGHSEKNCQNKNFQTKNETPAAQH